MFKDWRSLLVAFIAGIIVSGVALHLYDEHLLNNVHQQDLQRDGAVSAANIKLTSELSDARSSTQSALKSEQQLGTQLTAAQSTIGRLNQLVSQFREQSAVSTSQLASNQQASRKLILAIRATVDERGVGSVHLIDPDASGPQAGGK